MFPSASGSEDEDAGGEAGDAATNGDGEDNESGNESSSGSASDSSDDAAGTAEVCPICLSRFRGQEIGNPESCDHNFCLDHILEWAKVRPRAATGGGEIEEAKHSGEMDVETCS